jgi:hypothetical protein
MWDSRGEIQFNDGGIATEGEAMLDEFITEHYEEVYTEEIRKNDAKSEDSVRDILAQENLSMNLEELINLKREEQKAA